MSFDLYRFNQEMLPLSSRYDTWPHADVFAAAVINDLCRSVGTVDPLPDRLWSILGLSFPKRGAKPSSKASSEAAVRLSLLAFFLEKTCLGAATIAQLGAQRNRGFLIDRIPRFLDAVVPVEAEILGGAEGGAAFREEFVRRFCAVLEIPIANESAATSRQRLDEISSIQAKRDQAEDDRYERPDRIRKTLRQTWAKEKALAPWRQGVAEDQE
jgi:hypothetical protein